MIYFPFPNKNNVYTGSHSKSFSATSTCFAIPSAVSCEIADLNIGGPSSLSGGDVRWSKRIEVRSITYVFREKTVSRRNERDVRKRKQIRPSKADKIRRTLEYTLTLVISISVYSPGMVSIFERDRSGWTSFSSRSAPRMAISLSKANGAGPRRRCGT